MAERETGGYIDEKAADWIARLDRGPLSEEESQALDAWLNGDPRRRGALLRADAVSMLSESARALGPGFELRQLPKAEPVARPAVSRRKLLAWTGGCAVAASIIALGISAPAAAITTGLGEVRLVTLSDGSTVLLNTQTSVRVRYSDGERRIEVLYGEVYFTIVQDQRRPFLVEIADTQLRAARATILVRKLEGSPVDILVDQGDIALSVAGTSAPVLMKANTRLRLPSPATGGPMPSAEAISPDLVSRELAWRDGKLAFEGERLDQAAAAFARYSKTRIEVADPALAREPVTGLFSASDPAGFGRAAASLFGAQVERQGDVVRLTRPEHSH